MKKTCSLFSIKQRKKNFLTLCIRSCVLIAIPLLYFLSSSNFNGKYDEFNQGKARDYVNYGHVLQFNWLLLLVYQFKNRILPIMESFLYFICNEKDIWLRYENSTII